MLREYLELMGELWTKDVASYDGEFAHLKPSWAYPKPVQQPRIPILVGAGGTPKNFDWIVANADGWITTPIETDIEQRVDRAQRGVGGEGSRGQPADRRTRRPAGSSPASSSAGASSASTR